MKIKKYHSYFIRKQVMKIKFQKTTHNNKTKIKKVPTSISEPITPELHSRFVILIVSKLKIFYMHFYSYCKITFKIFKSNFFQRFNLFSHIP